ncbi:MAG: hypothetical protein ACYSUB_18170 [Planctomycetota bacterium]
MNSSADDGLPSISADGLSLFFMSNRPGGYGERDIWVTTRATTDDPWGEPVNLGSQVNRSSGEWGASISSDGLLLYFCSWRSGGYGRSDVYVTTRETKDDPWGTPMNLGPTVNSSANDECPSISADELLLFFHSDRPGNVGEHDIWVTTRATKDDDWATPVNLGPPINTSAVEWCSNISADGRTLFFVSGRYGGYGRTDIWVTRRVTTDDDWGEPVNLGSNVNTSTFNYGVTVSADGSTLFFRTGPFDSGDIWQAPIIPIVDLNGDEIVDSVDMCIMVDHWGTSEPLCDIGPMPWGDGIVDVQDLIVLSDCRLSWLHTGSWTKQKATSLRTALVKMMPLCLVMPSGSLMVVRYPERCSLTVSMIMLAHPLCCRQQMRCSAYLPGLRAVCPAR